jgi:LacI family transcriptional regulator
MASRQPITIRQVAHAAGVSTQTVSRVVNNHPDVAPETRQRVQGLIDQLGYRPNVLARSLIHRRSQTLGVVVTGLDFFGPTRTLVGIESETRAIGYSLLLDLLHHPEAEDVEQLLNRLLSRQVDGIIWAVPEIGANRNWLRREAPQLPVPVIYLNMDLHPDLPVVTIDNRRGGRLAAEHLLAQGYQQIGIITGPLEWWEARERLLGWHEVMQAAGRAADARQIVEGDWSAASGEQGFRRLLEQFNEIDAVFACNDQMALGVIQTAQRLHRRVPEDLAVVGFDNIPESPYFSPPLTTVQQPLMDLGREAVRELVRMIEAHQQGALKLQPVARLIQPVLIVRDSSVSLPVERYLTS